MSESAKKRKHSEETRKKMSEAQRGEKHHNYGKKHSEETRKKISEAALNMSDEHRKKISINHADVSGRNHPMYGKKHSEETRRRTSATKQGISYDEWESFAKKSPYCPKFDEVCRESNREKYSRECFICGKTEVGNRRKLSVHHVDMQKTQGCNGRNWVLVPLCNSCHGKSHCAEMIARLQYILKNELEVIKRLQE